jgi:hypothetical protein
MRRALQEGDSEVRTKGKAEMSLWKRMRVRQSRTKAAYKMALLPFIAVVIYVIVPVVTAILWVLSRPYVIWLKVLRFDDL